MDRRSFVLIAMKIPMALAFYELASSPVHAESAPNVVVFCDLSLRQALVDAGRAWEAKSGIGVRVLAASLEQNARLLVHGAQGDILIGIGAEQFDRAQQLGATARVNPTMIGRDPVVLAIRGPTERPVQLAAGNAISGLLADGRLGVVDTAFDSTGAEARKSLTAVGLWPDLERQSVGAESSDALSELLSDGSVRLATLHRTALAGDPTLSIAANFPTPAPPVLAALAMTAHSSHAMDFLIFLAGEGQSVLRQDGLEAP